MLVRDLKIGYLQYFVGNENIYCIVADQAGKAKPFRLSTYQDLHPKIEDFWISLRRVAPSLGYSPKGFTDFCFEWGVNLLPPLESLLEFDILVVVPHYSLHGLPLHTIRIGQEMEFLGTRFGVVYCSSATLFVNCVDRNLIRKSDISKWWFSFNDELPENAPEAPKRCLSFGVDVIGGLTSQYRLVSDAFERHFDEPKHEFENIRIISERPNKDIASNLGITGYTDQPTDSMRLIGQSRAFKLGIEVENWEAICIVCHGHHDARRVDNSGMLLEKDPRDFSRVIHLHRGKYYDFRDMPFAFVPPHICTDRVAEILTLSELKVQCQTNAQLVALYGCQTAAGQVRSGDEFDSIAYQWLKIGAASVLANMWEANIDFIADWNSLFLKNWLKKRQPKAIAFREALREMLRRDGNLSPHVWGTIALLGDWL